MSETRAFSVRLSIAAIEQIEHLAKVQKTNKNTIIRLAVNAYIAAHWHQLTMKVEDEEVQ